MSWYKQGEEGRQVAKDDDERRQKAATDPRRFWLAPDKSARLTFLDSEGFFLREHNFYKDGSWLNFYTCRTEVDKDESCPLCDAGIKYSYICVFTVIDHSKFTSKKGEEIKDKKRLLVLKSGARNKVMKQKERREGNLIGCQFEFSRLSKKESSTGDDLEFMKRLTKEELLEFVPKGENPDEFLKPYDYVQLFQPKSRAELERAAGIAPPVGRETLPAEAPSGAEGQQKLRDLL